MDCVQPHDAPPATREQLLRVHAAQWLDQLERLAPPRGAVDEAGRPLHVRLDADTQLNAWTLEAARHAAGAAVLAVDLVMGGAAPNAFCAVRPATTPSARRARASVSSTTPAWRWRMHWRRMA